MSKMSEMAETIKELRSAAAAINEAAAWLTEQFSSNAVELLTSPLELSDYKNCIMEAMFKGTKRNIESEDESL